MSKETLVTLLAREMDRVARNTENWQERMAALGEMQRAFEQLEKNPPAGTVAASLSTDVWKTLRPLKGMVQDLRSQIVKEVCALLTTISRVTRDAMAPFLREVLPTLVEVRGSGNKVCGTYCGECLEAVVTQTVIKGATLRLFVDILLDSKNKLIRLCCISCLRRALVSWSPVMDKSDVQQLEKGLQHALYDASSSCRAQAHELFLAFHTLFPKRALVVMSMVDYKIQKRLEALVSSDVAESTKGAGSASNASVDGDATPVQQVQALAGFNLDVGDRVCIPDKELFGFVRFLGEIIGVKGIWVGIELDEAYGKNDGSVKGRYYFRCKPKHGVFARPHQVFLTMSGSKLHEHQLQQQQQIQDGDSFAQKGSAELGDEPGGIEAPPTPEGLAPPFPSTPRTPPPAPAPASSLNLPAPTDTPEPSKLSFVLQRASVAHRRYLNRLLIHVRAELEEHERFENYGATASSADAVQYLQQLQNSAQDKIVLSDEFIQQIIQAQQAARES
ncbi:hypothetical protein L917_02960 [Phytophthora nicotianae]|uniref:CAP-Gly domain-containing protein n=9 Tax=Phytophthora nicotianae TaxID=4792 RepID=W2QPA6_PHYN3|nr:hypothetical protein PPTG_07762 [Phytophthora nicotianae INRA-310]ETI53940.1 hypothetical protein F443_03182 [Phytophthora nicotianae P1569]ETK93800.1 hypothetical protein L915_03061 [Phytophthora nicotianae]ETO82623.1 hypothetical protein F444_03249 [Phytophthora nicotianae P1976]ETM00293.1 hypothetical protein L917_02960 [Phytophthora nicotianae]ETM53496.1 hypothetical protein L914_03029 [Phytophthora nicotianae]